MLLHQIDLWTDLEMTFHYKVLYFRLAGSQGGHVQRPCRKRPQCWKAPYWIAPCYEAPTNKNPKLFRCSNVNVENFFESLGQILFLWTKLFCHVQIWSCAEQQIFVRADGWGKSDQSNLYNLVLEDTLASPSRALDSSLVSLFKTSIFENVVTRARADTDKDSIVEIKLTL